MAKEKTTNPNEVVLDFSGVKPFEPMDPDQIYLTQVTGFKLGTAKSSGESKASLELTIKAPEEVEVVTLDGKKQGRMTKAVNRKLFREYSLKAEALPFLYEFLKSADPDVKLGEGFRLKTEEYMGLEVAAKIQNEEFNEQIRPRVKRILPASAYTA